MSTDANQFPFCVSRETAWVPLRNLSFTPKSPLQTENWYSAMKFSHSITLNATPEWSDYYISYSNLKKIIYNLERTAVQSRTDDHETEGESLVRSDASDPEAVFTKVLDKELVKIKAFYEHKSSELFGDLDVMIHEEEEFQIDLASSDRPSSARYRKWMPPVQRPSSRASSHDSFEAPDEPPKRLPRYPSASIVDQMTMSTTTLDMGKKYSNVLEEESFAEILHDAKITLKKRTIASYVTLSELRSYIQLNYTGFSKILKKFDKILGCDLRPKYMQQVVSQSYPFLPTCRREIDSRLKILEEVYARLITNGDVSLAKSELKLHLREHVVWERNTVWREMIGIERKAEAARVGIKQPLIGVSTPSFQGNEPDDTFGEIKTISTPMGRFLLPKWIPAWVLSSNFATILFIILLFIIMLSVPTFSQVEQRNCFAMLIFVSALWATEAIPLFVTSLLVPLLVVILGVVRSDDNKKSRLDAPSAAKYIFNAMWSPVVMLLLGGFAIAAALSKYQIANRMATSILAKAGKKPRNVLFAIMFIAWFSSIWISNVAAPVLCLSIIQPVLRTLPPGSPFAKALILGIALSSNIGGMASPIASPQNIIALDNMFENPTWAEWFVVTFPVCLISLFLIWLVLLISYKPHKGMLIPPIRRTLDVFTGTQWFITVVTVITIILWCLEKQLESTLGDMGVVAVIPLVIFLAMGGIALGKAVASSGLLHTIAHSIRKTVEHLPLFVVFFIFSLLVLVIATFISHTVGALIILPVVAQIGSGMDDPHPRLLVMGVALICSAAMGLPMSGFPNMTAIMVENNVGQRFLSVKDFIKIGVLSSILAFLTVVSIGFILMRAIGF